MCHRDAEVVRRLKAAGAIVLGKTNTPEFGAGANTDKVSARTPYLEHGALGLGLTGAGRRRSPRMAPSPRAAIRRVIAHRRAFCGWSASHQPGLVQHPRRSPGTSERRRADGALGETVVAARR